MAARSELSTRLPVRLFANNLTLAHAIAFVILLTVFTFPPLLLAITAVISGSADGARAVQATLGTITGPLIGATLSGGQAYDLQFSLRLLPYCAPLLLIAILLQFIRLPESVLADVVRLELWILGWLVWFVAGFVSFAHAALYLME